MVIHFPRLTTLEIYLLPEFPLAHIDMDDLCVRKIQAYSVANILSHLLSKQPS